MKRLILFRGFHECKSGDTEIIVDNKKYIGKWVYGLYTTQLKRDKSLDNKFGFMFTSRDMIYDREAEFCGKNYEIVPSTLSQYIGLEDKNNNEIFENCKCKYCINTDFTVYVEGVVEYLNGGYILRYDDNSYIDFMFIKKDSIEVVGTKFDKLN